jgi:hypothetical protein
VSFAKSYIIQIDAEQILVTAWNNSANTLTVTRGYNGTTPRDLTTKTISERSKQGKIIGKH